MSQINQKKAFGIIEDAESYFVSEAEQKASLNLLEHCRNTYPVNCIIGEGGTGRTAAAFWVYHSLPYETHEVVYVSKLDNSDNTSLLKSVLSLFGYDDLEGQPVKQLFKKILSESEDILAESRRLLIVVDDPNHMSSSLWREQIEPLLAINNIQEKSFSFLLICNKRGIEQLEAETSFEADIKLEKQFVKRAELKAYLQCLLKQTQYADLMLNDRDLDEIYKKSKSSFSRLNELASFSFNKILNVNSSMDDLAGGLTTTGFFKGEASGVRFHNVPKPPVRKEKKVDKNNSLQAGSENAPIEPKQRMSVNESTIHNSSQDKRKGTAKDDSWSIIESLLKSG